MTTNWAGNVTYSAQRIARPTSVTELQEIVATSPRIRALGTRHSFSTVADGPGVLVSLESLPTALLDRPGRRDGDRRRRPALRRGRGRRCTSSGYALQQPGVTPAHRGRRGRRHRHPRFGGRQRVSRHLGARARAGDGPRGAGDDRTRRRRLPRERGRSGRPRRGDQPDAGRRADVRDPTGRLRGPALGGRPRPARRGAGLRLQRQPVHDLAPRVGRPGVAKASPRGRRDTHTTQPALARRDPR